MPAVVDANSDGLVDGSSTYKLFAGDGAAITLKDSKGKTYSDSSSKSWDVIAATETDSGFEVLLNGDVTKAGKYIVWTTDSSGVRTASSGWKSGDEIMEEGYEESFNIDLNKDSIIGLPAVVDANSDGLVDNSSTYKLFTGDGAAITLKNIRGRTYSDGSSRSWDVIAATETDSGFEVLLDGDVTKAGKYKVWTTDSSGVINSWSSWKTGEEMVDLDYEQFFGIDFNSNDVLGI